jgi:hypothetical protein
MVSTVFSGALTRESDSLALVEIINVNKRSMLSWDYSQNIDNWEGVTLNSAGRVSELNISHKELAILPPELGNLNALTIFDCSFNRLSTLPPEFNGLTSLKFFSSRNNYISNVNNQVINLPSILEFNSQNNQHHFDDLILINSLSGPGKLITIFPQDSINLIPGEKVVKPIAVGQPISKGYIPLGTTLTSIIP